jgi:hypothetical protein
MDENIEVETVSSGGPRPGGQGRGGFSPLLVLLGLASIGFGILVVVFPDVLAYMVATFFVMLGVVFLLAARAVRRAQARFSAFGRGFPGWE